MNISTIFPLIMFALFGVAVGSLLERALNRRKAPPHLQASKPLSSPNEKLASEGDIEILRAWRTLSGKIWLEMDGARLNGKESLLPDQRRRLVSMLVDLRPWLENSPAAMVVSEGLPGPAIAAGSPAKKEKLEDKDIKPAPVLKSIVEQIDDVLQGKLQVSSFMNRDIHLVEGSGGMVFVKDGLKKYEGIESVPEPEIKALIRQAVADWEKLPH
jgi:hypothetical protein